MTKTQVNIPLLRKGVEWVEEQAKLSWVEGRAWWQDNWQTPKQYVEGFALMTTPPGHMSDFDRIAAGCGTAYCFAGYIGQLLDPRYAESTWVDGLHVSSFAARALGLEAGPDPSAEANRLFRATNTAEDIRRVAEEIAGEPL